MTFNSSRTFNSRAQRSSAATPITRWPSNWPLARVIAGQADFVGAQFVQFAQIVQNHARGQQVCIQKGIDFANRLGCTQHRGGVVQKPGAFGVVQLGSGRVVQKAVAGFLEAF